MRVHYPSRTTYRYIYPSIFRAARSQPCHTQCNAFPWAIFKPKTRLILICLLVSGSPFYGPNH